MTMYRQNVRNGFLEFNNEKNTRERVTEKEKRERREIEKHREREKK